MAAAQYRAREGHLNVPRSHREPLTLNNDTGTGDTTVEISLGLFIANTRNRRNTIPATRAQHLTQLGMRRQ
ncbi:helicase associated domain-containing protein [Kitasatospora sp. NPDC059646]|uniref:helicase associated domain-containing protein n=1 Tax=Kitasatospora sp. NPDC059646 TaxID=3346893 RepID=UPI0036CEBADC